MGLNKKPSELSALVSKSLGLELSCIRACNESGSRASCLVHESWLFGIISRSVPSSRDASSYIHPASDYEKQLLLQPSHAGPSLPWIRVCIKVVKKAGAADYGIESSNAVDTLNYKPISEEATTVAELLQDIGYEAHQNYWNTALQSNPLAMSYLPQTAWRKTPEKVAITDIVKDVFGLPIISLNTSERFKDTMTSFDELMHSEQEPIESNTETNPKSSNVIPLICALETEEAYLLVEPFYPYGLHDIFTFSPAVMSHSTVRLLFVIYQLLHSLRWYHEHYLPFGNLTLDNVRVGKGLFLYLTTPSLTNVLEISSRSAVVESNTKLNGAESMQEEEPSDTSNTSDDIVTLAARVPINTDMLSPQEAVIINALSDKNILKLDLPALVDMWVRDEVTNYDYLMALNYFSGRRLGDPNHHPLFPWVTDFTEEHGRFRDLSKSKFRLNKGDHLLDMMYKQSWFESHEGGNSDTVPHHVSDVLSEITFHAYLARRTPVSVLCEHLRSNWVPNEYPASMQRLYEWTPDECIPQFFSDSSIFTSIHPDLPDLALPPWTATPEEFIAWHRNILESEEVSKHLHQWIDLTFGYKLSGKAAIKAKNVCLDLVSKRQTVCNYGVVQLFTQPHPPQSSCATLIGSTPLRFPPLSRQTENTSVIPEHNLLLSHLKPQLNESLISLDSIDDGSQSPDVICTKRENESQSRDTPRDTLPLVNTLSALIGPKESGANDNDARISEADLIHLPKECKPLDLLEKYEALQKFKRQFPARKEPDDSSATTRVLTREALLKSLMQKDMESLGCLIVEIVLTDKVRLITAGLSPDKKSQAIRDMIIANPKLLPRFVRNGVLCLLKQETKSYSMGDKSSTVEDSDDENKDDFLPPLSAALMLHPQTKLFPFPEYIQEMHSFIVKFNQARLPPMTGTLHSDAITEGLRYCYTSESTYSTSQVDVSLQWLPSLLPQLDDEGFQLLLYHLEPLFTSEETCLYAFTHLFDILAHAMGPKRAAKTFMKPLIKLCDSRSLENYEHIASQSFLSQIIVRFGLENFLANFASFVIDAVAFELMLQKTSSQMADRSSVHSAEEVMAEGSSENNKELKPQRNMYLSVDEDDDAMGDSGAAFSDQEETDDYTVHVDDVDDDVNDYVRGATEQADMDELDNKTTSDAAEETLLQDTEISEIKHTDASVSSDILQPGATCEANVITDEQGVNVGTFGSHDDVRFGDHGHGESLAAGGRSLTADGRSLTADGGSIAADGGSLATDGRSLAADGGSLAADGGSLAADSRRTLGADDRTEGDDESREELFNNEKKEEGNFEEDVTEDEVMRKITEENEEGDGDDILRFEKDIAIADEASSSGSESDEDASENSKTNGDSSVELDSDGRTACLLYRDTSIAQEEKEAERYTDLTSTYISGIAAESVMWLAPRLGPVLTSKYLTHQLLQMLPQCYTDVLGGEEYEQEDEDRKAKWVLYCLGSFCILYGEAFVLHQYLPFIQKIVSTVQSRFSARGEASVAAVLALLKYCIPYMSKETLVENFETLLRSSFQPVLRILSSWNTKFPGGGEARAALCHSYVDLLTVLSMKLERDLARELMTAPLQQFFSCFELVHLKKKENREGEKSSSAADTSSTDGGTEKPPEERKIQEDKGDITRPDQIEAFYKTTMYDELCQTFSPAMAHHAYVPLCGIMGSKYMETALYNHDLIWSLCCSHDAQLSHPSFEEDEDQSREAGEEGEVEGLSGEGTGSKGGSEEGKKAGKGPNGRQGSKPRIPSWLRRTEKAKEPDTVSIASMGKSSSDQYLRGNWLEHWKYQLHSKTNRDRGSQFHLQHVKLQTFTGHSGSVRSVYVQDSEHYFLSASKDKTVKLWSLSNHGGGTAQSASSCTYYRHTRGVFAVDMVESVRQAASCDGTVHIWDPVTASTLDILELPRGNSVVAMAAMPAPSQSVVVATSEATARFIDVRQCQFVQEWKTTTSSVAGTIRDICCSPDGRWIAVGFSSGLVSVLDVRGGLLRSQRRAHTSDILQVRAFSTNSLVTSSVDQGLSMWKDDGLKLRSFKGHVDPLHLLIVLKDDVISASTANRIGLHVPRDDSDEVPYSSCKLASDVFRGNITSMGYLPLNKLLLLGGDTGNITLCA